MLQNFGTPKHCIQSRNTTFASFYMSKVSEMLRNTPKHHFGSNGVEWMLHNFGTTKHCIQSRNTTFASFYMSKVTEMLRKTRKHHFGSNGVVSQLWYPEIVHSGSDASFASITCLRLAKWSETLTNINCVQWSRMDASQLQYPETVHSVSKHKFFIFYLLKVSEMIPKHSQTSIVSNGVEWMLHNISTLKQCIQSPNTSFSSFTSWRSAKWSETLTNINCVQWSRMEASEFQYPETVHSVPKHKFCIFYLLKVSEMIRNTHKHQLCPME
jgi:hypothetical protein